MVLFEIFTIMDSHLLQRVEHPDDVWLILPGSCITGTPVISLLYFSATLSIADNNWHLYLAV